MEGICYNEVEAGPRQQNANTSRPVGTTGMWEELLVLQMSTRKRPFGDGEVYEVRASTSKEEQMAGLRYSVPTHLNS